MSWKGVLWRSREYICPADGSFTVPLAPAELSGKDGSSAEPSASTQFGLGCINLS